MYKITCPVWKENTLLGNIYCSVLSETELEKTSYIVKTAESKIINLAEGNNASSFAWIICSKSTIFKWCHILYFQNLHILLKDSTHVYLRKLCTETSQSSAIIIFQYVLLAFQIKHLMKSSISNSSTQISYFLLIWNPWTN